MMHSVAPKGQLLQVGHWRKLGRKIHLRKESKNNESQVYKTTKLKQIGLATFVSDKWSSLTLESWKHNLRICTWEMRAKCCTTTAELLSIKKASTSFGTSLNTSFPNEGENPIEVRFGAETSTSDVRTELQIISSSNKRQLCRNILMTLPLSIICSRCNRLRDWKKTIIWGHATLISPNDSSRTTLFESVYVEKYNSKLQTLNSSRENKLKPFGHCALG